MYFVFFNIDYESYYNIIIFRGGIAMSDYELLTIVLMFLGIVVSLLMAYINSK